MSEQAERLKARVNRFALGVIELIKSFPREEPGPTLKHQLARSATGIAANYRATCRARSHDEFIARMGITGEEADETVGWLEIVDESRLLKSPKVTELLKEARELAAIFSASLRTALRNRRACATKGSRR